MPQHLVSMKMSKQEAKKETEGEAIDTPKFPWGLSIRLDNEAMDKLNMGDLPKVGSKMQMTAMVNVESTEESERAGGGKRRHMSLQITDMGFGNGSTHEEKADKLFGGK